MRRTWLRVDLQSVCARSFQPEEASEAKSWPLASGGFPAGTCSKMKLRGVSHARGRLRETGEERGSPGERPGGGAVSGLRECCSPRLRGSPRPRLLDCPSCPLFTGMLVVHNPSGHLQRAFAGLCCIGLDMPPSGLRRALGAAGPGPGPQKPRWVEWCWDWRPGFGGTKKD